MTFGTLFGRRGRSAALGAMVLVAIATGCSDNNALSPTDPATMRTYDQVQRLGNPLISEVLLEKRDHPLHGSIGPDQDVALIGTQVAAFVTNVAGRSSSYAGVLGSVLLPDMLIVQTDKDPGTAGWLNWVGVPPLANGWGGRKLSDDVTDLALLAVFGDPFGLDPSGAQGKAALTTDNVSFDSQVSTTFPYLGAPN
ncbi:MAG TPA: DUF4331 family protein [Gemmatimonadales bacterium]|nr:DUF4331 family protein [Gemmatimonadales bacterium]